MEAFFLGLALHITTGVFNMVFEARAALPMLLFKIERLFKL